MNRKHCVALYLGLLVLGLVVVGAPAPGRAHLAAFPGVVPGAASTDPTPDFQDVPPSSPFYSYLHNLYRAGVIAGYTCGGAGEPCIPPANLPYYRPGNAVTRLQMTKFIDLGRRNIADALGSSLAISTTANVPGLIITATSAGLVISSTAGYGIYASTAGGIPAIAGRCMQDNVTCAGVQGVAQPGDYSGYFSGGLGLAALNAYSTNPAIEGYGADAGYYGGEFGSTDYRALHVRAPPTYQGYDELLVDGSGDPALTAESIASGALYVAGNLAVGGSKSGYVVDAMQNGDSAPLEPGDVVVVAGASGPPVLGAIPVPVVRRAAAAYDTGVLGIVDQVLYVPAAATKAAYAAQEQAIRDAETRRDQLLAAAAAQGTRPDLSPVVVPQPAISDAQGTVHAVTGATQVPVGGYANVVTLGSYKAVKVDASFGAIAPGDLLTTSPHAGYAMKVQDKMAALGALIGKALGAWAQGTGTIPVLVTLR